ncbi:MAG: hypothetical protein EBT09_13060, partial [Actinobacteria bacterium]|nr:hypothetical protein [Actinomycetota bacterium]
RTAVTKDHKDYPPDVNAGAHVAHAQAQQPVQVPTPAPTLQPVPTTPRPAPTAGIRPTWAK